MPGKFVSESMEYSVRSNTAFFDYWDGMRRFWKHQTTQTVYEKMVLSIKSGMARKMELVGTHAVMKRSYLPDHSSLRRRQIIPELIAPTM